MKTATAEKGPSCQLPLDGAEPCAGGADSAAPADAFFAAFREASDGVRFADLAEDTRELVRLAAAFRKGEGAAANWLIERGWPAAAAREAAQAFALVAGEWLLSEEYDDHAALLAELRGVRF